jgi:imidazolonepropionase-like amidohydrolase
MPAPPSALTAGPPGALALTNAALLPMTGAPCPGPHTVLVERGVITAIVPSSAPVPAGVAVLDCGRRTVMPGLIDMHAHVSHPASAALWLAHGVTAVRDMWGSPVQLTWRADVEAGRLAGPRLVPASPYLDGVARYPGVVPVESPEAARAAAAAHVRAGYAALKIYSGLALDALHAVGTAGREAGIPVVGHCPDGVTIDEALRAGQRGFEHLLGLQAGHPSTDRVGRDVVARAGLLREIPWDDVRRAGTALASHGATVTPTLTVLSRLADRAEDRADDPALAHVPAAAQARWARAGIPVPRGRSAEQLRAAIEATLDWHRTAASVVVAGGATLLVGTDAGSIWTVPGFSMADEIRQLQQAGFGAGQILAAATASAADACDQPQWGRIAVGSPADLLVLDADPLRDPTAATRPAAVVMGGLPLHRAELDAMLAEHTASVETIAALPSAELAPMARPEWFAR